MSAQTVLLDFSIEPSRICDEASRQELLKILQEALSEYFPSIKLCFETVTTDGYLCILTEKQTVFISVRFFNHGIITINIEYFKSETEQPRLSFYVSNTQLH